MSREKFNIEEVFKSELEDFEMNVPKNGWSNLSTQMGNAAKVGKATTITTASAITTITSIAIAVGATIYAVSTSTQEERIIRKETPKAEPTIVANKKSITNNKVAITEILDTQPTENLTLPKVEKTIIDPVIEQTKKQNKTKKETYIFRNPKTERTKKETDKVLVEKPLNITKKPIKPLIKEEKQPKEIEVITVEPTKIIASISASPVGGHAPLTVDFSHPNENTSSLWNFKDGEESRTQHTSHTFEEPGEYLVELTLVNENSEEEKVTKRIVVSSTSKIKSIPNIFTPNNDGINDVFKVNYENMETYKLYIYNKKGVLIFESNEEQESWDGNTNFNTKAKADNYIYVIKAKGNDGKNYEENGMIKLAR